MGKSSSAKQNVTEYRMSVHFGVALKLDSISEILVDEKTAWSGTASSNTTLPINKPDLFGGERDQGGLVGAIDVLMGGDTQVLPAAVAARYGEAPENCPAFRGLTTLFFRGSGTVTTGWPGLLENFGNDWSTTVSSNGFLWRHNSPFIAQKVQVRGTRAPKGLTTENQMIGADANPAAIIYECLVDQEFGMGGAPSLLDKDSFEACAATLNDESFGLTIFWMRQSKIEDFIVEILDHIQATFFLHPATGLVTLKLLRNDYDLESLREITPDNAILENFRIRSAGEVVNEITVNWTNPANEQSESITAQDLASIESQGGQKVSASRDYYGIRSAELARTVLERDLRASTAPLASLDAELDRSHHDLLPGEVCKVVWPRRADSTLIMRAGRVNYGRPGSSSIKVPFLQDVFSLRRAPVPLPPTTEWEDPSADPAPLDMQLITLPSFMVRSGAYQRQASPTLTAPEVLVASLADSASSDSLDYELVSSSLDATGATIVTSKGALTLTPRSELLSTLTAAAESELPPDLFPDINEGPTVGGFLFIGYGDANQEIAVVTERTDTAWVIARGCLDTTPRTWGAGTPIWAVNPGARIVDEQTIHAAGDSAVYRGLDRTSRGKLAYEDASDETIIPTERPHLPLRPANVKVGGVAFGTYAIGSATSFAVTWATRSRLMEDAQVLLWTDGSVPPEYRQETVVSVYDLATDDLIGEYAYLWTETSLTFQKTDFDRYASIRVVVSSRIDEMESLTAHSIVVSGFANNPAAGAPPPSTERPVPPSTLAEPEVGAFTAVAGSEAASDGTRLPTIVIAGQQDNPAAEQLVARYRVAGAPDWSLWPSVTLDREILSFPINGVLSATEYEIGVAYVIAGLVGRFRSLSNVTTVSQMAGDVSPTSPVLGEVINNNFDQVAQAFEARITEENQRRHQDDDKLDRFDVLGDLNPIDRTAVLRGDAVSTAPEGLLLEDVSDRVGAGLSPWGDVALPIPTDVSNESGLLRRFGGGAGGVAGQLADRDIVTTPFVEVRNITRLARYESPTETLFSPAYSGPVTTNTSLFQVSLTATGETIVAAGKFLARIHHSQDDFFLYVSVWRLGATGPEVKVFDAKQRCFTSGGDGFVNGWQCMDFSDTPPAGATTYDVRVRHSYSIGSPGPFDEWASANRTFDFREHLR